VAAQYEELIRDTGDNLHFGLARLMAQSAGLQNVELVVVGDDVSVPRSRGNMVGRRCLAGITLGTYKSSHASCPRKQCLTTVCKILGAGAEDNMGFQELVDLGRAVSTNTGSICAALDHCHVPGRSGDWQIPAGRVEIGLGLHNETVSGPQATARSAVRWKLTRQGVFNIAHPSGEELIAQMLDLVLKQDDPERSYVKFKDEDQIVLLLNNQGGMSALEMGAILDEILTQLGK